MNMISHDFYRHMVPVVLQDYLLHPSPPYGTSASERQAEYEAAEAELEAAKRQA